MVMDFKDVFIFVIKVLVALFIINILFTIVIWGTRKFILPHVTDEKWVARIERILQWMLRARREGSIVGW